MEYIDNEDIKNFANDGAILCKGIFCDWIDKLRVGVDKLIANPRFVKDHMCLKMERPHFFKI